MKVGPSRLLAFSVAATIIISLPLTGCEDPKEKAARQLLGKGLQAEINSSVGSPTAIYMQVIKLYPDTKAASDAKKHLADHVQQMQENMSAIQTRQGF